MRILVVTSDRFPPFRPAARVIFGRELPLRGHHIDWLLQAETEDQYSGEVRFANGTAYVGPTDDGTTRFRRLRKYWLDLRNDLRMCSLIKNNKYDIIQVKDKYVAAILALVAAKFSSTPCFFWLAYPHPEAFLYEATIGTARYPWLYMARGNILGFLLYKCILRFSDHIFVQSKQMAQDLSLKNVPADKMTPVPSSISLAEIGDCSPIPVTAPNPIHLEQRIVYLGTLMRARKLDFLIRSHALLLRTHPRAKLIFIGKGEMSEDIKMLTDESVRLSVESNIEFTGQLPMKEAWDYVKSADLCVSPYYPTPILRSTSPTKLIEYMAMGKAVVCNDHPEQNLVISESAGGLCVPWDESEFARAIAQLLDDPVLRQEMGARGRAWVERERNDAVVASIVENRYMEFLRNRKNNINY